MLTVGMGIGMELGKVVELGPSPGAFSPASTTSVAPLLCPLGVATAEHTATLYASDVHVNRSTELSDRYANARRSRLFRVQADLSLGGKHACDFDSCVYAQCPAQMSALTQAEVQFRLTRHQPNVWQ